MKRKLIVVLSGGVALLMFAISAVWACGSFSASDMTLENNGSTSWDSGSDGLNYSECSPTQMGVAGTGCVRSVKVTGKNFVNSDAVAITSVDLYWLDEPFYAAGLGGPNGAPEQIESEVCRTKGVLVASGVSVTNKEFSVDVNVPPTDSTYADGTARVVKTYYGLNAICAVWFHDVAGTTGDHYGSIGNGYNIWPA